MRKFETMVIMKCLFLNLPYKTKVVRKYNCSYNSPTFLVPPIELISLSSVFQTVHRGTPYLIDAIAENLTIEEVTKKIELIKPDFLVSIIGFEIIEEDVKVLNYIKGRAPELKIIVFGHLAGEVSDQILAKSSIDIVIRGEPENIFSEIINALVSGASLESVSGITYRSEGRILLNKNAERIPNPNKLPVPSYELLSIDYYSEPFFPKPYAIIQSARGCPYTCNYCVTSFGNKLTALSPENMLNHVKKLVDIHNIKSFRFIDDTFTATPGRVISFCKLLIENNLNYLKWSCFSRPDTLNREMVRYMKMAGCRRIYFGIESGSQRVLDFYNKGLKIEETKDDILYCRKTGIETIGFFMVGSPPETLEDLNLSIKFASDCKFNFVTIFQFAVYPGTLIFERLRNQIHFSALPYENRFTDAEVQKKAEKFQKLFFQKFYFRIGFAISLLSFLSNYSFAEISRNVKSFIRYLYFSKKDTHRKDYI